MKKTTLLVLPVFALIAVSATIDLGNPENYSMQVVPAYIMKDNTPPNNQLEDKGATLGRVLFYDKKLSVNNSTACAGCHHQQFAFGDTASASTGAQGNTGRHAMRLVNVRFADERKCFWDERAATLEQQTTMPVQDHNEMGYSGLNGDPSINDLVAKMNNTLYYSQLFTWAYGSPQITEQKIQQALAKFIRSIQSFDSRYDVGRAMVAADGQPFPNFTAQENQGKQLFLVPPQFDAAGNRVAGGAGCAGCHRPPEFDIDPNSRNNGVTGSFAGGNDFTNTRSPSLRNVVDANGHPYGGFMHNAGANGLNTLLDVINHYDSIPANNPTLDPKLRPGGQLQRLHLTMQEKNALVAFVRTLTGNDVYTNARWSDPFVNDSLSLTNTGTWVAIPGLDQKLSVYPTVVTTVLHIDVPPPMANSTMVISGLSGQIMYRGHIAATVDMTTYARGMYIIRFANGQAERVVKN